MVVYDIEQHQPNNGSKCLVWMGTWWRDVTYYTLDNSFYTGDGHKLRYKVKLWFFAPHPVATAT